MSVVDQAEHRSVLSGRKDGILPAKKRETNMKHVLFDFLVCTMNRMQMAQFQLFAPTLERGMRLGRGGGALEIGVLGGKKYGTPNTFFPPGPLTGMMGAAATAGGGKTGPETTQRA